MHTIIQMATINKTIVNGDTNIWHKLLKNNFLFLQKQSETNIFLNFYDL